MKAYRRFFMVSLLVPTSALLSSCAREDGATSPGDSPGQAAVVQAVREAAVSSAVSAAALTEAPTGFDNLTNGFASQADMDTARDVFDEVEELGNGLGPVYNAQSCRECHQN